MASGTIKGGPISVSEGGTGGASVASAFYVGATTVSGSSTSGGSTYQISHSVNAVSGYEPICVCGWNSSGMTYLSIANMYIDGSGYIRVSGRNLGNSAVTPTFDVHVLYGKSS